MLVEEEARTRRKSTDARARVIYRWRKRVWRNQGASVRALAGKKAVASLRWTSRGSQVGKAKQCGRLVGWLVGADADYFHCCTCPSSARARAERVSSFWPSLAILRPSNSQGQRRKSGACKKEKLK